MMELSLPGDWWTSGGPAWLGVLVAVAAVVVTVIFTRRDRTERRAERQADEDARRRAQAEQISVVPRNPVMWVGGLVTHSWGPGTDVSTTQDAVPDVPETIGATIRNAATIPAHDFWLEFYFRALESDDAWAFGGAYRHGPVPPESADEIVVNDRALRARMRETLIEIPGSMDGPSDLAIGYRFTDNAGIRWRLTPGVGLREDSRGEPNE